MHYIEGPHTILANNLSWFNCLVKLAQIAEEKSLVDPAEVSNDEYELYLLEQENTGLNDDEIWQVLECYLNLSDIPHLDRNH